MGCASSKPGTRPGGPDSQAAEHRRRGPASAAEEVETRPTKRSSSAFGRGRSSQAALPRPSGGAAAAGAGASAAPNRQLSSLGSSDSDSDADSDWDRYSWCQEAGRGAAGAATPIISPRDATGSLTLSAGSLTGQLRLRQDSLFGISTTPRLSPVRDSGRLRLCKVAGVTFVNQYMVIKYLGRGSSGRVFLCMSIDDHRLYAVKIVKKDLASAHKAARSGGGGTPHRRSGQHSRRDPLEDLRAEIAVMRRALHPNIVALREVVDDGGSNKMLLVMDYLEGGPVMTREGLERGHRVPEEVARLYFRDMCKALDYLHCHQRVVHGDLKPENALMGAGGRVALSDFGCSKAMAGECEGDEEGEFDRCNGTPAFLAPEMMRPHARYRGRPADVYALGGCLYSFVFGRIPFKADTVLQLFEVVQTEPVAFPPGIPASLELKELLLGMLEKDPAQRLSLPQVMTHSWMTAGGALPPLRPSGRPGCRGAVKALTTAFDNAGSAAAASSTGNGGGAWGHPRRRQGGSSSSSGEEEEQQEAAAEQEEEAQQEQLLRASLEGLVAGEVQVQAFAAGEPLMVRGQPGAHLMYILEGECEVWYRTTPPPDTTTQPSPRPAAGEAEPPCAAPPPQQQQALGGERPPPPPPPAAAATGGLPPAGPSAPAVSRQRSAAGLFAGGLGGNGSRPGSALASTSAEAGVVAVDLTASGSMQIEVSEGPGQQEQREEGGQQGALCSRRTSSYIADAAVAAAAEGAPAGSQATQQQQQHRHHRRQHQQHQLGISLPAGEAAASAVSLPPELGLPSAEASAAVSAVDTPTAGTPRGASAAPTPGTLLSAGSSRAPTPGPYGLRQHMSVDIEGAAAHLQSPADLPPIGRSEPWRRSSNSSSQRQAAAGGAEQAAAAQQQPLQHQEAPPPEVVGEELPPTLLEAATRARELLAGLRRGPRDFLAGLRGPGDFVGEMEVLGGSQSRRVATVVAASGSVRAAVIPYTAAKAYLSRHPLAKQQLAQLMWLRQSEDLVLEALARLASLGEEMLRLLPVAQIGGGSSSGAY